jgi:type IV fimbrial biogenesis protein FimT
MNHARETGFTLVELMITLVVVGILLATALPQLETFTKNNRLAGQTNELIAAIQLARAEAVKRGVNTVVCASTDQASCSGNNADWVSGWLVFSDFDLDNTVDAGADATLCEATEDCVMRTVTALSYDTAATGSAAILRFLPTGLASNGGNVTIDLVARDCQREQARKVTVTTQGHTIVTTENCP